MVRGICWVNDSPRVGGPNEVFIYCCFKISLVEL